MVLPIKLNLLNLAAVWHRNWPLNLSCHLTGLAAKIQMSIFNMLNQMHVHCYDVLNVNFVCFALFKNFLPSYYDTVTKIRYSRLDTEKL